MQVFRSDLPAPGTPFDGGFYAGEIIIDRILHGLVIAPKANQVRGIWNSSYTSVEGALSLCDGMANTQAMAAAGSELALSMFNLRIGDKDDWYIPAVDELEVMYRTLKPTTDQNALWNRSGINVSAVPPTYPYMATSPVQTLAEAFQAGGAEAFDPVWHWTSTQYAANADYAWMQFFADGDQRYGSKGDELAVRPVRRFLVI